MSHYKNTGHGDPRLDHLHKWLKSTVKLDNCTLSPASSDASFRRYFRVASGDSTYIAMDAPPPMEDVHPFVKVAKLMLDAGVKVPKVHACDAKHGYLLLDDFGSTLYLDRLDAKTADGLYKDALDMLLKLQTGLATATSHLPDYHEAALGRELDLFHDWFLQKLLGLHMSKDDQAIFNDCSSRLIASANEQPSVVVHRDYHSRNLMVMNPTSPGVLDFQDAAIGPITYDLVSLLRDCYIAWPQDKVERWALDYAQRLRDQQLMDASVDDKQFLRWFDLMGIQRHLKAIGIFSRLKLRDHKTGYLKDIPRTLGYIQQVAPRHPDMQPFLAWLEKNVVPRIGELIEKDQ